MQRSARVARPCEAPVLGRWRFSRAVLEYTADASCAEKAPPAPTVLGPNTSSTPGAVPSCTTDFSCSEKTRPAPTVFGQEASNTRGAVLPCTTDFSCAEKVPPAPTVIRPEGVEHARCSASMHHRLLVRREDTARTDGARPGGVKHAWCGASVHHRLFVRSADTTAPAVFGPAPVEEFGDEATPRRGRGKGPPKQLLQQDGHGVASGPLLPQGQRACLIVSTTVAAIGMSRGVTRAPSPNVCKNTASS